MAGETELGNFMKAPVKRLESRLVWISERAGQYHFHDKGFDWPSCSRSLA